MAQSLANIVVHLVFSTKGRRPLLRDGERGELHAYITGVLRNHDSPLIEINSVRDHVHILFAQSKNHAPAKIVEQVKSSSSGWLKTLDSWYADFAWQGATANSASARFMWSRFVITSAHRRSITSRKIFKPSFVVSARRTASLWTNAMRGIEQSLRIRSMVSPLQGFLPFNAITQGFTLGFNIAPLRG